MDMQIYFIISMLVFFKCVLMCDDLMEVVEDKIHSLCYT